MVNALLAGTKKNNNKKKTPIKTKTTAWLKLETERESKSKRGRGWCAKRAGGAHYFESTLSLKMTL